ncbi:MAG: family 4 glycosyl hydrolase, partial [Thermodesulfobacteriota bacterium]
DSANQALYAACQFLHLDPDSIRPETFCLNHLSWTRALLHEGRNLLEDLLKEPRFLDRYQDLFCTPEQRESGLFFNEYLYYYLWPVRSVRQMATSRPLRGAWLAGQEKQLVNDLKGRLDEQAPEKAVELFLRYHAQRSETYMAYARGKKRGSTGGEEAGAEGYAGVALDILESEHASRERVRVLVLPNKRPFLGLPEGVAVEVSCRLQGGRLEPILEEKIPEDCARLIRQVGDCERLVAESILEGSNGKLRRALEQHPLVGPEKADACMRAFDWARSED